MKEIYSIMNQPTISGNPTTSRIQPSVSPSEAHSNFANKLKQAIEGVNQTQIESNEKTEAMARGEINDLHDVMISSQKASITMQTTVEVQNKVIEAYKEIMRMQV